MPAKNNDTLRVHYTGTLEDGTEFDSSRGREPLEFVLGKSTLIEGFERALIGREQGETVRVTIPPAQAYGDVDDALLFTVPLSEVPSHLTLETGMQLSLRSPEGDMEVSVGRLDETGVVLDANHPLAGKSLTFDIEIVSIK